MNEAPSRVRLPLTPPPRVVPERAMCGAWRGLALVAVVALAAFAALLFGDRAEAGTTTHGSACINGEWTHTMNGHPSSNPGSRSGIPCDEPMPGWNFDIYNPGHIVWAYDGDRVPTPYTNPGSDVVHIAIREVNPQGNLRPQVNQPLAEPTSPEAFTYIADMNNRAVRGDDGECYREWRVSGRWLRSGPYGSDAEACRRASWNAYSRSQDHRLNDPAAPTSAFLLGNPPDPDTLVSTISHPLYSDPSTATNYDVAQGFTTGDNDGGYVITALSLYFDIGVPSGLSPTTTVEIWSSSEGGRPENKLATLGSPSSLVQGVNSFSASDVHLQPGTTYFVVLDWTPDGTSAPQLRYTSSPQDVGAPGWSMSDQVFRRLEGSDWVSYYPTARVSIDGYAR